MCVLTLPAAAPFTGSSPCAVHSAQVAGRPVEKKEERTPHRTPSWKLPLTHFSSIAFQITRTVRISTESFGISPTYTLEAQIYVNLAST